MTTRLRPAMTHLTRAALATGAVLALLSGFIAPANASTSARTITVNLPEPKRELELHYFAAQAVGPDTTMLRLLLPDTAKRMNMTNIQYSLSNNSMDEPVTGPVQLVDGHMDIPVPAGLLTADSRIQVSVSSDLKRDGRLERAPYVNDWTQMYFGITVDPNLSTPVATFDFTGPKYSYFSHAYNIGIPTGPVLKARKGDVLAYTLPGTDSWKTGPNGASHANKVQAFYGYQALCGRSRPSGCGGGIEGTSLPVRVSADGKTAYVTLPKSLGTPTRYVDREVVWLQWWPPRKHLNSEGTINVTQAIHVS